MSRQNYFNTLTMAQKLDQLGRCRFMDRSEFNGVEKLRGKKVVIVGCGAQGLNQGLNMRDSGLDISYALRADAIAQKRVSFTNATSNGFKVGTYEAAHPHRRPGLQPGSRQAARRRGAEGDAADEEGRLPRLQPRLQHRRRGAADPQGPDGRHGGAQVPRHRGARGVQAGLRRADVDRGAPGERSERRRPGDRQGLRGGDRRRSRGRARVELHRRGEERPHGRADHPLRHAADRLDPLLRPDGGPGDRPRLRQQAGPVRLGDHHRGAQAGRPHLDDGSPEQPGEGQGLRAGRRAARPHARRSTRSTRTTSSPAPSARP